MNAVRHAWSMNHPTADDAIVARMTAVLLALKGAYEPSKAQPWPV